MTKSRPDTNNATKVGVGLYLINFDDFDEKEGSFKLEAYLLLTWKDKRLTFNPTKNGVNDKTYQAIAFNIVIAEELPKVPYLTYLNGFILIVYIFITLVIIYTVVKHRINLETHKEVSLKIHRTACWLVPLTFGVTNIVLI
ncbi:hypothetical protein [Nostoc sp.]|uniref:hypothetical protein n=1 Tax=Nostoc sp. TaxID=1180 RepID=UPI002FFD2C48